MTNPLGAAMAQYVEQRRELTAQLLEMFIFALDLDLVPEQIGLDSPLFGAGLGLDSVDAVAIAAGIESRFEDIRIDDSDIPTFRSVNSIVDFIMARRKQLPPAVRADPVAARGVPDQALEADYRAIRESVAMLIHSDRAIIRIRGADHETMLESVISGNLSDLAVYGMMQTLILGNSGQVEALLWVGREEDGYFLVAAEGSGGRILELLNDAATGLDAQIEDVSADRVVMSILGPKAQDFITSFFNEDLLRLGYNEFTEFPWQGELLNVSRYGETGEFDYRIMMPGRFVAEIGEAARAAGAAKGLSLRSNQILPTLCLEMKSITQDIVETGRFYPSELDLQGMVWTGKESFRGRQAVIASLDGFERRTIILVGADLPALGARVSVGKEPVGTVLAGAYSFRLEAFVALAAIDKDYSWPSLSYTVGEESRTTMTSRSAPLFLPESVRMSLSSEDAAID